MIENSDDFRAWMIAMGKKRGQASISQHEAHRLLGYSRESIAEILASRRRVPTYIALACMALESGLPDRPPTELAEGSILTVRLLQGG